MSKTSKIKLAVSGMYGRKFVQAVCKHHDIPENEIEYVALLDNIFDDIWLLHKEQPSLNLGEEFDEYVKARQARNTELRRNRRKNPQLVKADEV